jgi:hypothetical protein
MSRALSLVPLAALVLACRSEPPAPVVDDDAGPTDVLPTTDTSACALAEPLDRGGFDRATALPTSGSVIQDKAFFLATLLADPSVTAALAQDPTLEPIRKERESRLRGASAKCGAAIACFRAELGFTDDEAKAIASALPTALGAKLADVAKSARASGHFVVHAKDADGVFIGAAWSDTARALDATFDGFAAALDGASLAKLVDGIAAAHPEALAFHAPLVLVDLAALAAQQRDEAARYEPLATGENAAALAALASVDWGAYPYTSILVPGQGPESLDQPISFGSKNRADLAARRWRAKLAPVIVVSGGHVHPDRTPYSEAMEMKKYLIGTHGVPASAILVDPHARHTTTNLRNAARLLFRSGIPADRPALVTSDKFQSLYIAFALDERCKNELGYTPYRIVKPVTDTDSCWMPNALSLEEDGRDPLDP